VGSQKLVEIGQLLLGNSLPAEEREAQKELVSELAEAMVFSSICGLGQSAAAPLTSVFDYFEDDLKRHEQM
jgi:NADH:ubiquinone oxidoreductase subunit F (NADH-binding)